MLILQNKGERTKKRSLISLSFDFVNKYPLSSEPPSRDSQGGTH